MTKELNGPGLFRQEAIEAHFRRLHGEVIIRQSLPGKIAAFCIAVLLILASTWVVFGKYARIETARGMLVPAGGYAKVYAPHPGVATELLVRDSDLVRIGDRLAVIRVESPDAFGKLGSKDEMHSVDNQTQLATKQIEFAAEHSRDEVERLTGVMDGLRQQGIALREQVGVQEQIVKSMSDTFEAVAPVVKNGFISKVEFERRRQALLSSQEDIIRLRQQSDANASELLRTERERAQAILTGRSNVAGARSALETLFQQKVKAGGQNSYAIVASVSGRVTGLQISVGRVVDASVPLMALVSDGAPLKADLFVPSRAIGFIRPRQEVRLLYDSFPYQRFGSFRAQIDTVSRLAVVGPETGAPFEIKEPVYRVTAILDAQQLRAYGHRAALQPGMTLQANIILERESFLDWLLDPLRSVSNRI